MILTQSGVILFTENYAACVKFYSDQVGLPIVQQKDTLTKFEFGGAYLMVEMGGPKSAVQKARSENPTVLRFDVSDVAVATAKLNRSGIEVAVSSFVWGTIGVFYDPGGNRCELKNAV